MTEQHDTQHGPGQQAGRVQAHSVIDPVSTGNPQVDGVLRTLDTLSELPVDQHVAVFEAAHTGLRDALSGARPGASAPGRAQNAAQNAAQGPTDG